MTRAVNIDALPADVIAMAAKHNAVISAIEALAPSGTRVVFQNAAGAASIAAAFGALVIEGPVTRVPWKQQRVD
ncbi:MAG: hypothetical protein EOP62_00545 [Sphingomonadales bacterium]|nr:MAG: hypothetical protein EOP62_00545 [Sphingomonadales bacterium]